MPQKKGSKPIWIEGTIHAAFKEKLKAEGWNWGMTKKVESLMAAYVAGSKGSLNRGLVGEIEVEVLPKPGESGFLKPEESQDRTHERKSRRHGKSI